MQKRWVIKKHDHEAANRLAAALNVKPLTAALLMSRGHDNEEKALKFLHPSYDHLHEPMLLKGMPEDVDRV